MVTVAPALAEGPAQTAERWGLLGLWKRDCNRGPSKADPSFRYIVRGGTLYQDSDIRAVQETKLVTDAVTTADGMLELTIVFAPQAGASTLVLRREGDSQVLVWSLRAIGTDDFTIKDGKYANGNPARPVLTQCSRYEGGK